MASTHQVQNAILTEHLSYTPLRILDDIINGVNEVVYRAINAIDEGLSAIPAATLGFTYAAAPTDSVASETTVQEILDEQKATELGNGLVQLESLLNSTIDKDFDKFEIYTLRNILALGHDEEEARGLAEHVVLDHYKHLDVKAAEGAPSPEDLQLQRAKLRETKKLNIMLKAEEAKNAAMLEQLGGLLGTSKDSSQSPFAFLMAQGSSSHEQPTTEELKQVLEQLPAIRDSIAQLKGASQTLASERVARPKNVDSAESKRSEYLDTQSRRALQRNGITPEPSQQMAGAASTGRKVGRDEVEGLEAVVQALGGAPATRNGDDMETD
ncbi:hypothetical protein LTR56_005470 [Elasticomyces elasticus]|nr:hypothetical protein LTR56_005470 [Elasticomyces elasticus]KAK3665405.1 hypothetical protein LTR22_003635 [Elasticomyces elasticus]KAK4929950.1 hypothetical protein LTR49_003577 [Elasticomyces elasticus]KAK5769239.1 hypothetical protein LTS12_000590 [Elasticomyces elasticus]